MPWACVKVINEWALDNYGDLLVDGDQVLNLNQNLAKTIQL
jgi:hypothetical protein